MIDLSCECGYVGTTPESSAGGIWSCPQCGRHLQLACAESLPDGAGQGDFDAYVMIVDGPDRVSQRILLGGVAAIEVGKGDDRHVKLPGHKVSRHHCAFNRVDFGPSRWEVEDRGSTNGTFINGNRITKQELKPGDTIQVGEYQLQFDLAAVSIPEAQAVPAALSSYGGGAALPPLPPAPTAKTAPAKGARKSASPTIGYQAQTQASEGPRPLGECDINWVMKLRNASTLMVYTIILGWVSNKLVFVPYAGEVADMISYAMSLVAAWLITSPEPDAPMRWAIVRWPLRLAAIGTCAGGILSGLGLMMENDQFQGLGLILLFCLLPQTALFLFYLNRLASRIPNPGLAFLCILLMIATPIFMGMGAWAAFEALRGGAGGGTIGLGLLAILGLVGCRLGYIGSLIWFNKSFS